MSYCKHFVDRGGWFSSNYKCNVSGKEENIPNTYFDCCKNEGYKCPWYENAYGTGGGCFISTVTCDILNKKDDNEVINKLRNFRDEVLQNDEKYEEVLKSYDVIGPFIANKLLEDQDKEKIAETVYDHVLTPISKLVENKEYSKAVEAYYQMTLMFVNYYGMKKPYNYIADRDYGYKKGQFNPKTAGHGTKRKKISKILD